MLKRIALILTTCATFLAPTITQAGLASWYRAKPWEGRKTASGEIFRSHGMTAACASQYKLHTKLNVTNKNNGKSVIVKCNDRGAFHKAKYGYRSLDLSKGAFSKIAPLGQGVVKINIKKL